MSEAYHRRPDCRLCGSADLQLVLGLTPTPPANAMVTAEDRAARQETFPLDVFFCRNCFHVQITDIVDPRVLFERYLYVSGTSKVFVKHLEQYTHDVIARFSIPKDSLAVEIGSNDGTQLSFFQKSGMRVLGIDPAKNLAADATRRGIETIAGFFTERLAKEIRAERGPAKVVTANNVFAHIDDLAGIVAGVRTLLAPDGVFVFEVSYLVDVYEKTLFDTIYHEHLSYHSVKPLARFFAANGMEMIEAERVTTQGGSLRGTAQLKGGPHKIGKSVAEMSANEELIGLDKADTLAALGRNVNRIGNKLNALLHKLKAEGKKIAGFGAPAKATTLMYQFNIDASLIDYIVEENPLKQGMYTPGKHIPVVAPPALTTDRPDYLVILAWNFAPSIIENYAEFRASGGKFIVPLPEVTVV